MMAAKFLNEETNSTSLIAMNNIHVATAKTARNINRRIVLNLIREHQPISRADLSRRSSLQRSTTSSITEQLISERWVTTGTMGDQPRGRKPALLHLNGDRLGIIGIDIRPQETTMGLADAGMRFLAQESMPTGGDSRRLIAGLCERLQKMIKSHPHIAVEGIGVAVPGQIEFARHIFPNQGWNFIDVRQQLETAMGLAVELENAANACAVAEILTNSHLDGVRNLIVVTVSDAIGVGMILNGQLVRGPNGRSGDFGHVTIQKDGPVCQCGNRGCFEVYASNAAAVRHFNEIGSNTSHLKPILEPDFDLLLRMYETGNRQAGETLDRMAHFLGIGLLLMITGLAPDAIVIAGEVTKAWGRVSSIVNEVVRRRLPTKVSTRILPGASGIHSRMRGPISLVLQKHFGSLPAI